MIKKFLVLSLLVIAINAHSVLATDKGELHGSIGGYVLRVVTDRVIDDSETYLNHNFRLEYFVADYLRLDLILNMDNLNFDNDFGADIGIGGRYFYLAKNVVRIGGGGDIILGLGEGRDSFNEDGDEITAWAIDIVPAELQIWPMKGGAFTASLSYRMNNLSGGDIGTNEFGINLGMVVRIK